MAAVSSAYRLLHAKRVAALRQASASAMALQLDGFDGGPDEFSGIVTRTARAYSRMGGALSASYYNGIRKGARAAGSYSAAILDAFDLSAMDAASRAAFEAYAAGASTVPLANTGANLVDRAVKAGVDNTIRNNARRDPAKPRYAFVPDGDACAFCVMRASNGYTQASDDFTPSHDHCSCVATPVFGDSSIDGYDPGSYLDQYNEAAEAYRLGDIPDELAERIAAEKEAKGRDFDTTKAVLMVMREQQGIK